jgi:hypothetical protein
VRSEKEKKRKNTNTSTSQHQQTTKQTPHQHGGAVSYLMIDHLGEASAETTLRTEGLAEVTPEDVHLGDVHVVVFADTTTGLAKHTDRAALVQHDAELVLFFHRQQTGQVNNVFRGRGREEKKKKKAPSKNM